MFLKCSKAMIIRCWTILFTFFFRNDFSLFFLWTNHVGATLHNVCKNRSFGVRLTHLLDVHSTPLHVSMCCMHWSMFAYLSRKWTRETKDNYTRHKADKINDTKFASLLSHWMSISIFCCHFTRILLFEQFGFVRIERKWSKTPTQKSSSKLPCDVMTVSDHQ